MKPSPDSLAGRIYARVKADGRGREEIARAVGVAPKTLSVWGSGTQQPKEEQLERLAAVLGVSVAWLRYGVGNGHDAGDVAAALTGARQEGYEAGYADGRRAGLEEATAAMDATTAALRRRVPGPPPGGEPAPGEAPAPVVHPPDPSKWKPVTPGAPPAKRRRA